VNRATDEALRKMVPFRMRQIKLMHLMQHLANHYFATNRDLQNAKMVYRVSSSPPAIPHSSLSATLLLRYGSNPFPQSTLITCISRFSPSTRTSK
jgi:hypothetical protein